MQFGIEGDRIQLAWASAAEGVQLAEKISNMVEDVRQLGPLNWKQSTKDPYAEPEVEEVMA